MTGIWQKLEKQSILIKSLGPGAGQLGLNAGSFTYYLCN